MTNEELAAVIQSGRTEYTVVLWNQVKRFASRQAHRILMATEGYNGVTIDDLLQESYIAMLEALEGWSADSGRFLTWYGFPLKRALIAAVGLQTKRQQLEPLNSYRSLNEPMGEDDDLYLGDIIEDPKAERAVVNVEESDFQERFRYIVIGSSGLNDEQRLFIELMYYKDMELTETAQHMGQSLAQVRNIQNQAIRVLRHPRNSRRLLELVRL